MVRRLKSRDTGDLLLDVARIHRHIVIKKYLTLTDRHALDLDQVLHRIADARFVVVVDGDFSLQVRRQVYLGHIPVNPLLDAAHVGEGQQQTVKHFTDHLKVFKRIIQRDQKRFPAGFDNGMDISRSELI